MPELGSNCFALPRTASQHKGDHGLQSLRHRLHICPTATFPQPTSSSSVVTLTTIGRTITVHLRADFSMCIGHANRSKFQSCDFHTTGAASLVLNSSFPGTSDLR